MIKKILYIFTIILIPCVAYTTNDFNFAQAFARTIKIRKPFDLIAAYQNIAKNLKESDSTRLAKKFLRNIQALNQFCQNHEDNKTLLAYKTLLQTALSNKKLSSMDYTDVLSSLLKQYAQHKPPYKPLIKPNEIIAEQTTSKPSTQTYIPSESKESRAATLQKNAQTTCRSEIINLLLLKKLSNQIEFLKDELALMKKDVSHISRQGATIKQTYRKLLKLENDIRKSNFDTSFIIRSPWVEELPQELEEELEAYSPYLRKIIIAEVNDSSSPFFHSDDRTE